MNTGEKAKIIEQQNKEWVEKFPTEESQKKEIERLKELGLEKIMLEEEEIKLYPQVRARLKKEGVIDYFQ